MMYGMDLEFSGEVFYWRGPSPYYFVGVPEEESLELRAMAGVLSYGWGCIKVEVRVGDSTWTTSLMPKNGLYVLPLKDKVRFAESFEDGDTISVQLATGDPR